MRFATVSASSLLITSAMGAVSVTFVGDAKAAKLQWVNYCRIVLRAASSCIFKGEISPDGGDSIWIKWQPSPKEANKATAWCTCPRWLKGDPPPKYSYARKAVNAIIEHDKNDGWEYKGGEDELEMPN